MTVKLEERLIVQDLRIRELELEVAELRERIERLGDPAGSHPYRSALSRSGPVAASAVVAHPEARPGVLRRAWGALGGKRGPVPDVVAIATGSAIWISFGAAGWLAVGCLLSVAFTVAGAVLVERWRERPS
jgi:hypothetical protein